MCLVQKESDRHYILRQFKKGCLKTVRLTSYTASSTTPYLPPWSQQLTKSTNTLCKTFSSVFIRRFWYSVDIKDLSNNITTWLKILHILPNKSIVLEATLARRRYEERNLVRNQTNGNPISSEQCRIVWL